MTLDPVEILKQLVAIPSVNPMGREVTGEVHGAAPADRLLGRTCQGIGLTTHRQTVAAGHDNLIARLDGQRAPEDGGLILLDAHQDTVPVDGMTIPPFQPEEREGRLYGRGACDTKGGMAAILAAVSRLAQHRPRPAATVIVSFTIKEKYGFAGEAVRAVMGAPTIGSSPQAQILHYGALNQPLGGGCPPGRSPRPGRSFGGQSGVGLRA